MIGYKYDRRSVGWDILKSYDMFPAEIHAGIDILKIGTECLDEPWMFSWNKIFSHRLGF